MRIRVELTTLNPILAKALIKAKLYNPDMVMIDTLRGGYEDLKTTNRKVTLAYAGTKLVGWASIWESEEGPCLGSFVAKSHRGQGVATKMMKKLVKNYAKKGGALIVHTSRENKKLFEKVIKECNCTPQYESSVDIFDQV